jgi:hypothetical protein
MSAWSGDNMGVATMRKYQSCNKMLIEELLEINENIEKDATTTHSLIRKNTLQC